MKRTSKPYRTIIFYSGVESVKKKLDEAGIQYTCRDVLSTFWGVEFSIAKPTGKGATSKCQIIRSL